jgi:hypothetical protein
LPRGDFYNFEDGYEEDENEIQVISTSQRNLVSICHGYLEILLVMCSSIPACDEILKFRMPLPPKNPCMPSFLLSLLASEFCFVELGMMVVVLYLLLLDC